MLGKMQVLLIYIKFLIFMNRTCIMRFHIKGLRFFQTGCLEVVLMIFTLNSDYFLKQRYGVYWTCKFIYIEEEIDF
jgi:hypothetical protein